MNNYKRVTLIVYDSFGVGQDETAERFGDTGANTYQHIREKFSNLNIPTLEKLGINNLIPKFEDNKNTIGYYTKAHEMSNAKESMSGHWEMMGIVTKIPFPTFTEKGFPKDLIFELEKVFNRKIIGNKSASGTEILYELGEREISSKGNEVIVYTSNDPVLQICANENVIGLDNLYKMSKQARKICSSNSAWNVGRVIARPYIGTNKNNFQRTSNRHDYAVKPVSKTYLDKMRENNIFVQGVGKIGDLFSMVGIDNNISTKSNLNGIKETLNLIKKPITRKEFIFTNLVDFDALWGHRRDVSGYARGLEEVDPILEEIIKHSTKEDLIIVTADHGNDPTYKGTDHTRELVPVFFYSKNFSSGGKISDLKSFAGIGATISENFGIKSFDNDNSVFKKIK